MDPVFRFIFVCLFVVYKRLQKYGKGLVGLGFQYMSFWSTLFAID